MNFNLRIILHVYFLFVCLFVLYSALIWIHEYALNKNRCYLLLHICQVQCRCAHCICHNYSHDVAIIMSITRRSRLFLRNGLPSYSVLQFTVMHLSDEHPSSRYHPTTPNYRLLFRPTSYTGIINSWACTESVLFT